MNNIYAIDWSHRKGLAIYDGKKGAVLERKSLLKKLAGESTRAVKSKPSLQPASIGAGGESTAAFKSTPDFNLPAPLIILEQGCPLSLIYDIFRTGCQVKVISNRATQDYRVEHSIEKSDENDARIIYELANNGAKLTPVSSDDSQIQLIELYQRYKRYQKARVAMMNMRKAYIRQSGDGESNPFLKSIPEVNPSPDSEGEGESTLSFKSTLSINPSLSDGTLPYDIGIDTLKAAEDNCLKSIIKLAPPIPQSLKIRGLGPRIWAGIYITANPANFPTLSAYLRYCGLVNLDQLNSKYSRHAKMLYHMLADEVMKLGGRLKEESIVIIQSTPHLNSFTSHRAIYDKCKADIATRYPEYTKAHIHNAALNRTATFLAKEIWSQNRTIGKKEGSLCPNF